MPALIPGPRARRFQPSLPASALAGTESRDEADLSTTGNNSETMKAVPIATQQYA